MKKRKQTSAIMVILIIIGLALIGSLYILSKPTGIKDDHLCLPEQRNADACIQLYKPVCGWFNPEKVQCIKYPCAITLSNSCYACSNPDIISWTEGECPTG